jgi:hypothetical protein
MGLLVRLLLKKQDIKHIKIRTSVRMDEYVVPQKVIRKQEELEMKEVWSFVPVSS